MLFAFSSVPKGLSVGWTYALEPLIIKRFHPQGVLSVTFVSVGEMRRLNLLYRGKDAATDVLSFRLAEDDQAYEQIAGGQDGVFGEILFCEKELRRHARERGTTLAEEFRAMLIHATLHVMGYDHEHERDARSMETLERNVEVALRKNLGKVAKIQYTKDVRRTSLKKKKRRII